MDRLAGGEPDSLRTTFRQFFALERDILVLSAAMFAFSLGFQMTSRYIPRYMSVLGGPSVSVSLGPSGTSLVRSIPTPVSPCRIGSAPGPR